MIRLYKWLIILVSISAASPVSAKSWKDNFRPSMGINVNASTLGAGGDLYWNCLPRLSVRAGYNKISFKTHYNFHQDNISLNTKIKYLTSGVTIGADYQFLGCMYVTGGVGVFSFKPKGDITPSADLDFGDITLSPESIGGATIRVENQYSVAPYMGIGLGKITPRSRVSFAFELGAYYMGQPEISIDATGMLAPSADPEHSKFLSKQFSQYKFYPIVKFSIGVKLFKFKR